jgi:hypothetical protein
MKLMLLIQLPLMIEFSFQSRRISTFTTSFKARGAFQPLLLGYNVARPRSRRRWASTIASLSPRAEIRQPRQKVPRHMDAMPCHATMQGSKCPTDEAPRRKTRQTSLSAG